MLLKEMFEFSPKSKRNASFGQKTGRFPFFTSSNIVERFVNAPDYSGEYLIIGDGGTGNCKYYKGEFSVSDHNYLLRPKKGTNALCVNYFLMKDGYKVLNDGFKGVGIKNVSKKYIESIDYAYNKNFSENEIVTSLQRVESLIDEKNKQITALDSLVKSRFMEMFGDPNHDDLSKSLPLEKCVTIRDEMRKPINGVTRAKMQAGELFPYYGATGQVGTINEYLSDFEALCIAEDCGNYGPNEDSTYVISGKCWVNNHAHLIQCNKNVDIRYLQHYLNFLDITQYINGATRSKLTQSALKTLPILVPSMDQQLEFKRTMELIDKSRFVVQKEIKDLQELLDSKMDEYFGGEE